MNRCTQKTSRCLDDISQTLGSEAQSQRVVKILRLFPGLPPIPMELPKVTEPRMVVGRTRKLRASIGAVLRRTSKCDGQNLIFHRKGQTGLECQALILC